MSFAFPWALLLLPLSLLLLRKKSLSAIQVSSLAGWKHAALPRRVTYLKALRILRAAACALLIFSLAGPRTERTVHEEIRQGIAMEMLLDNSSSMDRNMKGAESNQTTRMEASKAVVEAFIGSRTNDLVGLITFARYADTLSPLTFGHSALIQLVQDVTIQDRPNEDGTAYGDALMLACAHLDRMNDWRTDQELAASDPAAQVQSKIIILLTDGENNCGLHLPQEAAGLAKKWSIRLYTISLADTGETESRTDAEQLLETISEATDGAFWKINDRQELTATYAAIDRLEKSKIKNALLSYTEQRNVFLVFALPALLLLLLEQLLGATFLRVAGEVDS
jgi:Ca-activated chloride channel family protein